MDFQYRLEKAARTRAWYRANRDRALATKRAYYLANKAAIIAKVIARRKVKALERRALKAAAEAARDKTVKTCTTCEVTKPLTAFGYHKASKGGLNSMCKTCNSAKMKVWRLANRERHYLNLQRHRARRSGAKVNDFTLQQWEAVKDMYGGCCHYCGEIVEKLTPDHVTPLARGGDHTMSNIVPACQSCNTRKNDRPVEEFYLECRSA